MCVDVTPRHWTITTHFGSISLHAFNTRSSGIHTGKNAIRSDKTRPMSALVEPSTASRSRRRRRQPVLIEGGPFAYLYLCLGYRAMALSEEGDDDVTVQEGV